MIKLINLCFGYVETGSLCSLLVSPREHQCSLEVLGVKPWKPCKGAKVETPYEAVLQFTQELFAEWVRENNIEKIVNLKKDHYRCCDGVQLKGRKKFCGICGKKIDETMMRGDSSVCDDTEVMDNFECWLETFPGMTADSFGFVELEHWDMWAGLNLPLESDEVISVQRCEPLLRILVSGKEQQDKFVKDWNTKKDLKKHLTFQQIIDKELNDRTI